MKLMYSRSPTSECRLPKVSVISRSFSQFALLCVVLLLDGCAKRLPDYAAPKVAVVNESEMDMSDVISYRKLTRADFKGTEPPSHFDERMAAVTCVYTQPIVDRSAMEIEPATTASGHAAYKVTYGNLRYQALMNRNCSWWNSKTPESQHAYVLEHEQIHFALFEIAAREWSELPPLTLQVKAASDAEMKAELQSLFEARIQQRMEVLMAQNRDFDAETSLGHDPLKQGKWLQLVRSKLPDESEIAASLQHGDCRTSDAAVAAIARARDRLSEAQEPEPPLRLIEEAEAAKDPPECDSIRARILADKAYRLITESD